MKYVLVNPFNPAQGNGVNSYYESLRNLLGDKYEFINFSNDADVDIIQFRQRLKSFIDRNFNKRHVIIEAPETRAATLLLGRDYRVHVRLHTPLGTCQKYEGTPINQARYSDELRVIAQAEQVSSPSYGIAREIAEHLPTDRFIINKNPILSKITYKPKIERRYDVIFMGRFHKLKGVEYLNAFIAALPSHYKIALIGAGADRFRLKAANADRIFISNHIEGEGRFEYLANAKAAMVPSLFENCSMTVLEALSAGVPVITWKVGGNDEFPQQLVRSVEFDNIEQYVAAVIDAVEEDPISKGTCDAAITKINNDFIRGFESVVQRFENSEAPAYRSRFLQEAAYLPKTKKIHYEDPEEFFRGKKVFGFTISNEHIEEMWAPILHYLGLDYRLVCRRPLGFHSKFRDTFPIDEKKFNQYDWIADPTRIVDEINRYKPDFLLTHNGSHPSYAHAMEAIKELNVPIIYTELGWFPQDGNIYVDRCGVNGASKISQMSFETLTGSKLSRARKTPVNSRDVFIPAQLNNDTNIKVFSPRFRSIDQFVEYVIEQTESDRKIFIKPHPLDREGDRFRLLANNRVEILDKSIPASEILSKVGHVASLNSTVVLEALNYNVNIYSGGYGILSNKGIAIDLVAEDLRDRIKDELIGSKSDREKVIDALKLRQINLLELANRSAMEDCILPYSLHPIAEAVLLSSPKWKPLPLAAKPAPASGKPAPTPTKPAPAPAKPAPTPTKPAPAPAKPAQAPATPAPATPAPAKPVAAKPVANGASPAKTPSSQAEVYASVFKKACDAYHSGQFDQAATLFIQASGMAGSSPTALRCAAEAYVKIGDSEQAAKALERASLKLPDNSNIRKRLEYLKKPKLARMLSSAHEFAVPL